MFLITINLQFHPFDKLLEIPSTDNAWSAPSIDWSLIDLTELEFKPTKTYKRVDITINSRRFGF